MHFLDPGGNQICDLLSQLHPVQERAREAGSCKLFLEAIQNRTTSSGGFNEDLCYHLLRTDLEPHRVVVRVVDSIQFLKLRTCEHNDLGYATTLEARRNGFWYGAPDTQMHP